jgi:mycothiol synthase
MAGARDIPGLTFRRFRGESDYPAMVNVLQGSKEADQIEEVHTIEDLRRSYANLANCDPRRDVLVAEVDGEVIGYTRVWWLQESDGKRIYLQVTFLLPEWRTTGIGSAMLRHNERRLREIASGHPEDGPRFFEAWAADTERERRALLLGADYRPVRYFYHMMRKNLDDLPAAPMPRGLEVRPARPEHYRAIWKAAEEAFRDHWGAVHERPEAWYQEWLGSRTFDPSLWQVAWVGDQVAGMVLSFIDAEENARYGRKRGHTEDVSVRRPWRRRGLARALLVRSFRVLRERGMEEAALGVDTENPNGALRLYESVGFRAVRRFATYRKEMQ